jgi:CRP/FNR family transcriptional regulator, cyclic AMP receptor protein
VDQTFQLFSECVLCRRLERREKEAFFTRVRIRDFAGSETIFVTGSPADSMMIVLRGTVQIGVTSPKVQPHVLRPGEMFGENALLPGRARVADVIAATDCSLAIVDRHVLVAFLEQSPAAWQDIVSVLVELRTYALDKFSRASRPSRIRLSRTNLCLA